MIKFGTGGWRAIIGDEFIKTNIQILAKAMCEKMKAEGKAEGKAEAILELLEDYGTITAELEGRISAERDLEILKKWHKLAAKADSIEQFEAEM